jgi:hypothetical protein
MDEVPEECRDNDCMLHGVTTDGGMGFMEPSLRCCLGPTTVPGRCARFQHAHRFPGARHVLLNGEVPAGLDEQYAGDLARLADLEPVAPTRHPVRCHSHATEAYAKGIAELAIMRHGRWKSSSVMRGYVQEGTIWTDNAAARLGL